MSVSGLSASTQNYLKAIWGIKERAANEAVSASAIAKRVGLRLSTVSDALKKLKASGLIAHAPYGTVTLTDEGERLAVEMIRRHRLLETFLVNVLGYTWDQVHDEAEDLEHAVSDLMMDRIDDVLNFPRVDPHGDPIPREGFDLTEFIGEQRPLVESKSGDRVIVMRISDEDPALLVFLAEREIGIGACLEVCEAPQFSNDLTVSVQGREVALGTKACQSIWVKLASTN